MSGFDYSCIRLLPAGDRVPLEMGKTDQCTKITGYC